MEEHISENKAESGGISGMPVSGFVGVRLNIFLVLVLRNLLLYLTCWGFVVGTVIITLRAVLAVPVPALLWFTTSILPGLVWALIASRRATPRLPAVRAMLDNFNNCGGLLMTGAEIPLGDWSRTLPEIIHPEIKWNGSRTISFFALSAGFILVSFLIPQKFVNITLARPLEIGSEIEKLTQQVGTAEEANIISEEQAKHLKEQLEQLRRQTNGYDPVKTLEAIDHLEDVLTKEATKAASDELNRMQNFAKAVNMAAGLSEHGEELPDDLASQASSELGSLLQTLAADDETLKNALSPDTLKACKTGQLSPEQLKEIISALKELKGDISLATDKLCKAGALDPNTMQVCQQLADVNAAGLMAFIKENTTKMGMAEAVSAYCSSPGSGDVSRGRADATMTWTSRSGEVESAFEEQVLPAASMQALRDSIQMGVSPVAPEVVEGIDNTRGKGVLDYAPAGSGEAFKQKILPRHRQAVKRYFQRENNQNK